MRFCTVSVVWKTLLLVILFVVCCQSLRVGGGVKGFRFRGRQWNYSPLTDGPQSTGDFIHIRGDCDADKQLLTVTNNYTVQFAFSEWNLLAIHFYYFLWIHNRSKQPSDTLRLAFNQNYNTTMVANGTPLASVYCPLDWPADTPPVWTLGIRDWATDVSVTQALQSYYPFEGDIAEFRYWNRPLSLQEIQDNFRRTLNSSEIRDPSLILYLDPENIEKNVVGDKSSTKRLNGYLGGALGEFVQSPQVIPTSAPIVNVDASRNATTLVVLQVVMKESGDYPSTVPISIFAIDDTNGNALISGTSLVTMSIATLPDPNIIQISLTPGGTALSTSAGPVQIYSNNTFYATHIANDTVVSWDAQSFLVIVTERIISRSVLVNITISKNAAPIVGTNGGALIPSNVPSSYTFLPYKISNFRWPNASLNSPITWEYWFIVPSDTRTFFAAELMVQTHGRLNTEVGKNLVFDYGWNFVSGRVMLPIRTLFGMWHHAAMTSDGVGGLEKVYVDGELIDVQPGDIAGRLGVSSDENGIMTLILVGSIPIDELRIWTKSRTQDEIKSTMKTRLTGREPHLHMYHNFDAYSVNMDGSYYFKDLTSNGFDLICTDYNSPRGCPLYDSQVPIGGIVKNITFLDGASAAYWDPEGTDPDDDTRYLRFVIDRVPQDAKLFMDANVTYRFLDSDKRDNQQRSPIYNSSISDGSYIRREYFTPAVKIVPTVNGGGNPYDSFTYHVTDRLRNSASATVFIFRKCSPGYRLDNVAKRCIACDPGYYLPSYSYVDTCLPCPAGTAQPLAGQSTCVACLPAVFTSTSANTNTSTNNNDTSASTSTLALVTKKLLPKTTIGIDGILFYGTYQDSTGQASCSPCLSLSYATQSNAQSCDGQAFVPNYISLLNPVVNVKSINGSSIFSSLAASNGAIITNGIAFLNFSVVNNLAAIETMPQYFAGIVTPAKVIVTTSVLMATITMFCLLGIISLQSDPVIKASSPSSLAIAGIGIIVGFLSVIPGSLKPTKAVCIADIWMIPIGFSIVMGISISKTFRILRIFNNPRAMKIRMTNLDLFGYIVTATIGCLIIVVTILYLPSNDVTTIYVIKSIAIIIVSTTALATLIAIKFYTIFQNRIFGKRAILASNRQSIGCRTTVDKRIKLNKSGKNIASVLSVVHTMFKNRPGVMLAGVVLSVKKFGVVFWIPKLAMLMIEERILWLIDADPAKEQDPARAGIPEAITIPLSRFTIAMPEFSAADQSLSTMISSMPEKGAEESADCGGEWIEAMSSILTGGSNDGMKTKKEEKDNNPRVAHAKILNTANLIE
ncbi:hypothetical protein HDU76_003469 [Blyttiomyces sp. JEL0837]|nr:hypothetical protein HDU76_003469 [Blyttiomyces sp. JEL0837]